SIVAIADQFVIVVKQADAGGGRCVAQNSVTTGCRVGNHSKPSTGIGKSGVPTFSPNVNRRWWRRRYVFVSLSPLSAFTCRNVGSLSTRTILSLARRSSFNS